LNKKQKEDYNKLVEEEIARRLVELKRRVKVLES
jgi:hypothetical protein